MNVQVVIPAAGSGKRLGYDTPKAIVPVGGVPLLVRTLRQIGKAVNLAGAVILTPPDHVLAFRSILTDFFVDNTFIILPGGTERQESVSLGLDALDTTTDVCVIHDAARPFVLPESVSDSVVAAAQFGGATVAIPSTDTILEADADRNLSFTPERSRLWQCQTPQTFRISVINRAHQWGRDHGIAVTDDATLVKLSGGTVRLVMGSESNFKITSAMDLQRAEWMIAQGLV